VKGNNVKEVDGKKDDGKEDTGKEDDGKEDKERKDIEEKDNKKEDDKKSIHLQPIPVLTPGQIWILSIFKSFYEQILQKSD